MSRSLRVIIVLISLSLWFFTQSLIGQRKAPDGVMTDGLHQITAPLNEYLTTHAHAANALLVVSSLFIDLFGLFLIIWGIFGPTFRPFFSLLAVFVLRQLCQSVVSLPPPPNMIWHAPGFPSLFVTYGVSTDFFFSGHTAIAVLGAVQLSELGKPWLTWLAVLIAVLEAITVLVLRAHYTIDVITGAAVALVISCLMKGKQNEQKA